MRRLVCHPAISAAEQSDASIEQEAALWNASGFIASIKPETPAGT
jgi:hypothetical protein